MKGRLLGVLGFILISFLAIRFLNTIEEVGSFWVRAWYVVLPLSLLWFLEPIARKLDELNNFLKD
jgi:hypothetical protein